MTIILIALLVTVCVLFILLRIEAMQLDAANHLLERIIEIFTDPGDVVIDPCAGSGSTLLAAANMQRRAYGFEVNKEFYDAAKSKVLRRIQPNLFPAI